MNIETMRECLKLAETRSFTSTARSFYTTQPVLSRHIASAEKELGAQLFIRGKNGVQLTRAGRLFLEDCSQIIDRYDNMVDRISFLKAGEKGTLEIGYLYGACSNFLPDAVRSFRKMYPDVSVRYTSLEVDEILSAFDEKRINLAISVDLVGFDTERFGVAPLYPDTLCLIAPKGHPLSTKKSVCANDLAGETIIVPRGSFMRDETTYIQRMLSPVINSINTMELIGDLNSIAMSLKIERCVAIEFSHLRHYLGEEDFAFVPFEGVVPTFDVTALWKLSDESQALRDLITLLQESCSRKK